MTDNFRASILMVLTMAGFALEDLFIKLASHRVPIGEVLMVLALLGTSVMLVIARIHRVRLFDRRLWHRAIIIRVLGEFAGSGLGFYALFLLPLSVTTAIGQAVPVVVTAGAALFLREPVGWRRWTAVLVGLAGVVIIVQPGSETFQPATLLSIAAVVAFAARDLATRHCPLHLSNTQLNFWGYAAVIASAGLVSLIDGAAWVVPPAVAWGQILAAAALGVTFYYTLTLALRMGEASVVGPLRYARIVFVLVLAALVLDERPSLPIYLGLALVIGSGLYTILREAHLRRRRRLVPSPAAAGPV